MSDDHSYFVSGQASIKRIKHLMREMEDSDRAEELFEDLPQRGISGKGFIPKQRPIVVGDVFVSEGNIKVYYEVLKVNRRVLSQRKRYGNSMLYPENTSEMLSESLTLRESGMSLSTKASLTP